MRDYTLLICINIYFGRGFLFLTLKPKSAARQRWMSRAADCILPCSRIRFAVQQKRFRKAADFCERRANLFFGHWY